MCIRDSDAVGSDASKFVVDGNGVKKGVSGSNSSSGQSMGQYVISASTKQALNGASKAYMRSYVTYSYVVTSRTVNEAGIAVDANSTVYKTVSVSYTHLTANPVLILW